MGSDRVSRARPYSGTRQGRLCVFAYRALTRCGVAFHPLRLTHNFVTSRPAGRRIKTGPTTPTTTTTAVYHIAQVWALPLSLATTQGVEVSFLSSGYLDVSVPQLASSRPMYSGAGTRALPAVSFLIRKSRDQRMVSTSPRLIAAAHVLHRLLAPRHPPCALILLIERTSVHYGCRYGVFKVRASSRPHYERSPATNGRSLKTQQRSRRAGEPDTTVEVDVLLGEPGVRTAETPKDSGIEGAGAYRA